MPADDRTATLPSTPLVKITGDWWRGEGPQLVPRVLHKLFADPAHLGKRFWCLKNYARWNHQAVGEMQYGYGPSHGTIVARIEATPELREMVKRGETPPVWMLVEAANQIRAAATKNGSPSEDDRG